MLFALVDWTVWLSVNLRLVRSHSQVGLDKGRGERVRGTRWRCNVSHQRKPQ